jgi:hypothetical protein
VQPERVAPVRTAPCSSGDLLREVESWGVWGVSRKRGQLSLAIFSPNERFIRVLAANNPLSCGRPRKVYRYETVEHGRKWAVWFSARQFTFIALRGSLSGACAAHRQLFSKVAALSEANARIKRLASRRARFRRAAAKAERDFLLADIATLIRQTRDACPVRAKARAADGLLSESRTSASSKPMRLRKPSYSPPSQEIEARCLSTEKSATR